MFQYEKISQRRKCYISKLRPDQNYAEIRIKRTNLMLLAVGKDRTRSATSRWNSGTEVKCNSGLLTDQLEQDFLRCGQLDRRPDVDNSVEIVTRLSSIRYWQLVN